MTAEQTPAIAQPGTLAQHKQLVHRFAELVSHPDSSLLAEVIATDYRQHNPMVQQGLAGLIQAADWIRSVFPDITATVDALVAEGDLVVARITWRGTHSATFMGIAATQVTATWQSTDWWRVADGKLAEHWDVVDWTTLLQQLQQPQA